MSTSGTTADGRPVRHVVAGARGGQGATTVAVALAALGARRHATTLVAHDRDAACGLVGLGPDTPAGPVQLAPGLTLAETSEATTDVTVVDAGPLPRLAPAPDEPDLPVDERRWLVVRGPCYLSLRTAVDHPWPAHGVILLREPKRALSARDVAHVLGIPVVAEIPQDHRVARAVDAGTLLATVTRQPALADLARLVAPERDASLEALPGRRPAPDAETPTPHQSAERISRHLERLQHPTPGTDPTLSR